jgi:hypothetical protein
MKTTKIPIDEFFKADSLRLPTNFKSKNLRSLAKGRTIKKIVINRPKKDSPSPMLDIPVQGIKVLFTDGSCMFIDAWLGEFDQRPEVSKNKRSGAFLTGAFHEPPAPLED